MTQRPTLILLVALLAACNPLRGALVTAAGGPSPEVCTPPQERCRVVPGGRVPEACGPRGDGQRAYWPATPTGEPCAWGCEIAPDGGARCMGRRRDAAVEVGADVLVLPVTEASDAEVSDGE